LAPQTVARVLGVREQPGQPILTTLLNALKARRLLLVLDNCEHLLDACAHLTDALLRQCPGVHILTTSCEALGIAGELAWRVPSLALPDSQRLPSVDELAQCEAVRLFTERAAFAQPGFGLTSQNAAAVAAICARVDGIPLAIELAAARVRGLPPEQIATRLDERFRLLTGGSRTALPRQQTLRATIDWSYNLLTEAERTLLRRLAVFVGGCTIEAAEAVGAGDGREAAEVLEPLLRLVDKSLVQVDEQGPEARYRLLETVRQYARDRLLDTDEAAFAAAWAAGQALTVDEALAEALAEEGGDG
jgi:predicted ATPase